MPKITSIPSVGPAEAIQKTSQMKGIKKFAGIFLCLAAGTLGGGVATDCFVANSINSQTEAIKKAAIDKGVGLEELSLMDASINDYVNKSSSFFSSASIKANKRFLAWDKLMEATEAKTYLSDIVQTINENILTVKENLFAEGLKPDKLQKIDNQIEANSQKITDPILNSVFKLMGWQSVICDFKADKKYNTLSPLK